MDKFWPMSFPLWQNSEFCLLLALTSPNIEKAYDMGIIRIYRSSATRCKFGVHTLRCSRHRAVFLLQHGKTAFLAVWSWYYQTVTCITLSANRKWWLDAIFGVSINLGPCYISVVFPSFCLCFFSVWECLIIHAADNWSLTLRASDWYSESLGFKSQLVLELFRWINFSASLSQTKPLTLSVTNSPWLPVVHCWICPLFHQLLLKPSNSTYCIYVRSWCSSVLPINIVNSLTMSCDK